MRSARRRHVLWPALAIVAALAITAPPAMAHRQPEVFTTMVHVIERGEPRTHITHRLHAEDAIRLLGVLRGVEEPSLGIRENRLRLARYVGANFVVDGARLRLLGIEIDGDYVFVYEEGAGHVLPKRSTVLAHVDPAWRNFVNVTNADGTRISRAYSGSSNARAHPHRH